jgi:hypothetical protein
MSDLSRKADTDQVAKNVNFAIKVAGLVWTEVGPGSR